MSPSTTVHTDVCILGAGPHGLAAAVHLRRVEPDLRLVVLDPAGEWLAGWHEQFARADIKTLRSPIVHHPAPNPDELAAYIDRHGLQRSGLPYDLPTAEAFAAFCHDLVTATGLDDPLPVSAAAVCPDEAGVVVATRRGLVTAEHLIVSANPHRRNIPEWVWPLLGSRPGLLAYGSDVDLREHSNLAGERIVVVGGGLTGAHLACGAASRGADVHVIARRPLQTRSFDTDPGWLGPKYLRAYRRDDDPVRRLETARQARGGGTIPPWMRSAMDIQIQADRITLHEECGVRAAGVDSDGTYVLALNDNSTVEADRIWVATGTTPALRDTRFLANIALDVPMVDDLPVVDDDLRLGHHPVYVMGRLATVALGPAAGNLWGAQRAARRITSAITGVDLGDDSSAPVPVPPRSA